MGRKKLGARAEMRAEMGMRKESALVSTIHE
jgi:hypothetical protein